MMNRTKSIMMGVVASVTFMLCVVFLATAEAGEALGTAGDGQTHAHDDMYNSQPNHWVNPNHGNGSIGNCSKDGKFCWNITIGNEPHWGFPIEYYGHRAAFLIADGQIEWANMTRMGVLYLGVWSRHDNRPFDCTVNIHRKRYHCKSH